MMLNNDEPIYFTVSSLFLNEQYEYIALDNYIKVNNPRFNIRLNQISRTDKEQWLTAGKLIDKKHHEYFTLLSTRLNAIHEVDYDEVYWKQYFYLGLKRVVVLLYEFFQQVTERFDYEKHLVTTLSSESFYVPVDLEDFRNYLSNSEYAQEQLFAIYYELFYPYGKSQTERLENDYRNDSFGKILNTQREIEEIDSSDVEMLLIGVNFDEKYRKQLRRFAQTKISTCNFSPFESEKAYEPDKEKRDALTLFEESFDPFDQFVFQVFKTMCPTILVENYLEAAAYYEEMACQYSNAKFVVSEVWISDHQMSFFIAHLKKRGIQFIYSEHNGLQHPFINNYIYDIRNTVDYILTQGWYLQEHSRKTNLIPSGLMHYGYSTSYIFNESCSDTILYMTAPAYVKRTNFNGMDFFMGEDSKYYFEFQTDFFSALSEKILKKTIFRNAPIGNIKKWLVYDVEQVLGKYLEVMQKDNRNCSGIVAMKRSKLIVIDYLGSGYLEAFIHNIPCVIFLNKNSFLDDICSDIFDELIRVGIMQTDGKQAAKFISEIEKEPLEWWLSEEVQEAKNHFIATAVGDGNVLQEKLLNFLGITKKSQIGLTRLNTDNYKGSDLYSDGDIENDILEIVKYDNLPIEEILHQTDDWATLYHLSPVRQNLLSWYDFNNNASLLEIGGGCGAFSGLFANKLAHVKVVELSKRRADIIYNRHINHANLEILVGNLNDIRIEEKFDYVTLIGVLEYAGMFIEGQNPFAVLLKMAKSYLKPGGKLLIAIENKFGLKYWAGAREDHTGQHFDGIENYQYSKKIQTFGKYELEQMLYATGFVDMSFYYPMPDYKLPTAIFSEEHLPDVDVLFDIYSRNFDHDRFVLFNEREVYQNLILNHQFPFFANSFLVEAAI